MSRFIALGLIVVALPTLALGATSAKPSLRLVDKSPLIVRGTDFNAGERVVVTAFTGFGPRIQRTTAVAGRFRVMFRVPQRGCAAAFAVRARGASGSSAAMRISDATSCVPPPVD